MASTPELATISIGTQTIRKVRIRILPFLFVLYVICYLDRVNISIAALTMNRDLVTLRLGHFFFRRGGWQRKASNQNEDRTQLVFYRSHDS